MPAATAELPTTESLPPPAPAVYSTEEELTRSLLRKGTHNPGPGLYPRDGTVDVTELEASISEITIPGQRSNVVLPSGMLAVCTAVEFALSHQGRARHKPPKVVHGIEAYSQSLRFFSHLKSMGVIVEGINLSGATVEDILAREADVFFGETVANTPAMPVVNVHGLIDTARTDPENAPILIFDNTYPLSTGLDFGAILKPHDKALVVESATKSAMHNSEHLGVLYSRNEDLVDEFREFKATKGTVTSTRADRSILNTLEASIPTFHDRNRALFRSTARIALALAEAQAELGSASEFTVSFPTFADHPEHEYAAENLPDGGSQAVFMAHASFDPQEARQLLRRVARHPRIQEQIREGQIFLGQSFGFKEARLLYDRHCHQVRVAGGYGIDSDALAEALKEAAADV